MTWDPFGDNDTHGLLRNKLGLHDKKQLARAEFFYLKTNMSKALDVLSREKQINLRSWRRTHAVLFGDLYPWAGKLRHLDVSKGPVLFNRFGSIEKEANVVFAKALEPRFLPDKLGYVYGELAFNHPFLDGNGRSLNTVVSELCRRFGFDISWNEIEKSEYLEHLTQAVMLRDYEGLQALLSDRVIAPEPDHQRAERLLIRA